MVNCGDNVLGSQFFITLGSNLDSLDGEHCVFGEVVEGEDVLGKLNSTIVDTEGRPYQDIRITHTVVLHDPYDDPPGFEPRSTSPEPSAEMLASTRIGADESINDYEGKTEEEVNEIIADKEAKARATILEMVGDLPEADIAPPENVLFVCKLNPVTTDEDLEIIFSRFGKVVSCEVIRDKKTGDSLQYAFVEFENKEACERAYFKMDNVLIDDRRIHVDFSQSVAQYRWKGKGRLEIVESKEVKSEMNDLILKERAEIKVSTDGKIQRDVNNLKTEKERGRSKYDGKYDKYSDRSRNRSRDSRRDRSDERRKDRSKDRYRNRSRDRVRDRSREKKRDRSRDRDRSREKKRDRSRDRDRSREKRRERSRDRSRERRRSRSRERRKDYDKYKSSKY